MRSNLLLASFLALLSVTTGHAANVVDARIGDKEILTPAPAATPRINGPKLYGARPEKKFIYRIPTQGERPISFAVEGLPETMKLDAEKGIITGITPAQKRDYTMTFVASNKHGKAEHPFKLVVGDKLALTPPTGWNHWGGHASNIRGEIIRAAADLVVNRGLADVGFQYIGIDDYWTRRDPNDKVNATRARKHKGEEYEKVVGKTRDENGDLIPNDFFPDMKGLVDHIHAYGLKAGIYSGPGTRTCQGMAGSWQHEEQDARQFARWGFELLKYDRAKEGSEALEKYKRENPGSTEKDFWRPMVKYLEDTDRDFIFNLCQYGEGRPSEWAPSIGAQTWRTGGDLNHNVENYFRAALSVATKLRAYSKPGQWNDPDYIYVGRQVYSTGNHFVTSEPSKLDANQQYQYVSLWAMVCAPFFFSTDVLNVDDFTMGLLSNPDVMAINQDELGHVAEVVRDTEGVDTVMVKKLADGSKALGIFNRSPDKEADLSVTWDKIGVDGKCRVYDVWRQKELGAFDGGITVRLSPNGIGLFVIKR